MKTKILVDIDGTLTKVGERVNCLKAEPPNWDEFYERVNEDEPNEDVVSLVRILAMDYDIVLCSGRRESCREKTVEWMEKYGVEYLDMLLRANGDFRHDTIIKPELLANSVHSLEEFEIVLEDRNSMVKKWRELGLTCLQVADGDF